MLEKYRPVILVLILVSSLLAVGLACDKGDPTTSQMMMDRMDRSKEAYGEHLVQMADNGMLQEMAVVDHHFVAHSSELSGTGAATLDRLAPYLNTYGGTVRYETYDDDETLVAERIEHVREYLALAGCDMDRIQVEQRMAGGRTRPATEALRAYVRGTSEFPPLGTTTVPTLAGQTNPAP